MLQTLRPTKALRVSAYARRLRGGETHQRSWGGGGLTLAELITDLIECLFHACSFFRPATFLCDIVAVFVSAGWVGPTWGGKDAIYDVRSERNTEVTA